MDGAGSRAAGACARVGVWACGRTCIVIVAIVVAIVAIVVIVVVAIDQ